MHDAHDSEDTDLFEPAIRYTVGHLLYWNKSKGITVAMEDDREADADGDCQTITTIGSGMILQVVAFLTGDVVYERQPRKKSVKEPLDNTTLDVVVC